MDELRQTIDHITLSVGDLAVMKRFYRLALAPLGLSVVGEFSAAQSGSVAFAGFGIGRKGSLWLRESGQQTPGSHVCFRALSREAVRDFHAHALRAGGTDHGAPGVREQYHPAYYAAFVLDPEGHNIEAVCFEP
ncbi:MAG: catechol 2,3-dioxygenase-like lactoylglutathione lyase family enzyme [Myxococcota bacterium]|jgi:catechol 2,3-dioxygenase-like lactoylglutathione lyase family enzyme